MTFLSGFAEGFINERNRRLKREEEKDDQSFQYRMKYLTDQREKRDAKKLKEVEFAKKAQYVASTVGDPDFASYAYREMVLGGRDPDAIVDRYTKGQYKKNDKHVAPTTKVKVPVGVEDPYAAFPKNDKIDARIDEIDPTLRQPISTASDDTYSVITDDPGNAYVYKPNNEYEAGKLEDVQLEILKAEEDNDPERLRQAQQKLKAHQIIMSMRENAKAKAESKNLSTYVLLDPQGRADSTFVGEIRENGDLWNVTTNTIVSTEDRNRLITTQDDALKEWAQLDKDFGTKSADLRQATANYTAALDTSKKIINLLNKNQNITTAVGSVARIASDLEGEAKAAYEVFIQQKSSLQAKVDNGQAPTEAEIAGLSKTIETLLEKTETPDGVLGQQVHSLGRDAAQYDALMTALVYQMASSNGISMAKASDFDVKNFQKMVGADRVNAGDVFAAMRNISQTVLTKLDSERTMFNRQPSITNFKRRWKFDPNLEVPRVEELLREQNRADLIETFGMLRGDIEIQRANAAAAAQPEIVQDPEMGGIPPEAIDMLKNNPSEETKKQFDEIFGAGSADQILGE